MDVFIFSIASLLLLSKQVIRRNSYNVNSLFVSIPCPPKVLILVFSFGTFYTRRQARVALHTNQCVQKSQ